jgi:hypothetical protein
MGHAIAFGEPRGGNRRELLQHCAIERAVSLGRIGREVGHRAARARTRAQEKGLERRNEVELALDHLLAERAQAIAGGLGEGGNGGEERGCGGGEEAGSVHFRPGGDRRCRW